MFEAIWAKTGLHGTKEKGCEISLCNPLQVFSLLNRREEFIHSNLDIILVKSGKEPGFQVNQSINGAVKKAHEPVKDRK